MKKTLILASSSPRRREILEQAGFSFQVFPANADETIQEKEPEEMVKQLSERKADAAMELWKKQAGDPEDILILGADTIVVQRKQILGKPADRADAAAMLRRLQGTAHSVYTGVTLLWMDETGGQKRTTFAKETEVIFYPMTEQEIRDYVETGEGDDKAGAYAIQGLAMKYIREIRGDYHNVVGLPAAAIYQILKEYNLKL